MPIVGLALLVWWRAGRPESSITAAGAVLAISVLIMPSEGRGGGYMVNPNLAGSLLAIALPLAITSRSWWRAGLIAAGLVATMSIGAWLASMAGLAMLWRDDALPLPAARFDAGRHRELLTMLLGVALLVSLTVLFSRPWWHWRLNIWIRAAQMIVDHPGGAGMGAFAVEQFVIGAPGAPLHWPGLGPRCAICSIQPHAHNLFLQIGTAYGGLAGLALLDALLFAAVCTRKSAARAALVVLVCHNLVDATGLLAVTQLLIALIILSPAHPDALRLIDQPLPHDVNVHRA